MLLNIIFAIAATLFLIISLRALLCMRWARRLPALEKSAPSGPPARVSVVFAARDEQDRVTETLRHLLAQQEVELEIIPVDDRSRDCTGQILKYFAAEDPRVRPRRVDVLPDGWLGKCYACHLGASTASGEWILFTDADGWLKPDVIARAIAVAEREGVDHVTLTPGVAPHTIPAQAWHLAFLITLADWFQRVNSDHPKGHLGIGAFNLVRAETYRQFGGHETLRLTVVDDIKLGLLVRRCGKRTRAFIGGDDVECHWGVTVRSIIKIMEKNYFAAMDYRTAAAAIVGIIVPLAWAACVLGPFTGNLFGIVAGTSLLLTSFPSLSFARRLRWPIWGALFTPFIFPAIFYAILNSAFVTLRQRGIFWRGTFYPLDKLRAGNVR